MAPNRSTSIRVIAAVAKPRAKMKGTATEARARYLAMIDVAADFASLIRPRNIGRRLTGCAMGWSLRDLGFPQSAEDEADDGDQRQRRDRLLLDRLVDRAL